MLDEVLAVEEPAVLEPPKKSGQRVKAPNYSQAIFTIEGTAPLVVHAWDEKSREQMKAKQEKGSTAKRGLREAKDFNAAFDAARYVSTDGWDGFPAAAIRRAMVESCRLAGVPMLIGKLSIFVVAEGLSVQDQTPLIRILGKTAEPLESMVRVSNGQPDIRVRPAYGPGWKAKIRIQWDSDQLSQEEIANLLLRAGVQTGLCEGRPSAPKSCGMGWGTFRLL